MKWISFNDGFTSTPQADNGDNVVLKVLDYAATDETYVDWLPSWKTLDNRNYVRGFLDRTEDQLRDLPKRLMEPVNEWFLEYVYGSPWYDGRVFSFGHNFNIGVDRFAITAADIGLAPKGVIPVGIRENLIAGSDLGTALVGTPGTMPGYVTPLNCSTTVDAIGTQNGMNYVDLTINVASGTNSNLMLLATSGTSLPKSLSQGDPTGANTSIPIDFTWFLGIRPGAWNNINTAMNLRASDHPNSALSAASLANTTSRAISIPQDGRLRPFSMTGVVPVDASTNPNIVVGLQFFKNISGVAASLPLRIGWPVLDTTGWYHQFRRGFAHLVPLTTKTDTVFRTNRRLKLNLPVAMPDNNRFRRKFSFVFDCVMDHLYSTETTVATFMPLVRVVNMNSNTNILTLEMSVDNEEQGYIPSFWNTFTSSHLVGTDGVRIYPGRKFKIAASLDDAGLRWSVNGGTVNTYSDGTSTGISAYNVKDIYVDGTGYLFKRLDVFLRTFSNSELVNLSR